MLFGGMKREEPRKSTNSRCVSRLTAKTRLCRCVLRLAAGGGVLLAAVLLAFACYVIGADHPAERELRLRGCILCHAEGFQTLLPCLRQWQPGMPVRETVETRLRKAHPTLAGGSALEPLSDLLAARQLKALAAQHSQDERKALYAAKCAACHGKQGQGQPGAYPPLAGSEWLHATPSRLPEILSDGLQGPIQVKGEPWDAMMRPPGLDEDGREKVRQYITSGVFSD